MSNHVYKQVELTGSSKTGIEDAVNNALAKAHETIRNIQWFTVMFYYPVPEKWNM
ncbi:MAG: dodecin domain-containing protein, partial [Alcaligenaceae bacterium]|nr:dodecin domain-containing protein [Alcaligenaceae bacterium]